jgi:hypothetical protein
MGMETFGADDHITVGKYCRVDQAACLGRISQSAERLMQGALILANGRDCENLPPQMARQLTLPEIDNQAEELDILRMSNPRDMVGPSINS